MPEVCNYIDRHHSSASDFMFDMCDGLHIKTHTLFSVDAKAVQLKLYTDDLEIVNPLGPKISKHKITVFYVTLLNIPPEY